MSHNREQLSLLLDDVLDSVSSACTAADSAYGFASENMAVFDSEIEDILHALKGLQVRAAQLASRHGFDPDAAYDAARDREIEEGG